MKELSGPEAVDRLISAAGETGPVIDAAVREVGLARTARILADEVIDRSASPLNDHPAKIGLYVTHGDERCELVLDVAPRTRPVLAENRPEHVGMLIEYAAADLLRDVFGPVTGQRSGRRRTDLLPAPQPGDRTSSRSLPREEIRSIVRAGSAVLAGCSHAAPDLDQLALEYISNKWGGIHWFTPHYARHFEPLRNRPVRVLEIGIGGYQDTTLGGGSLRMWKRYFHRGTIYGLDVFDKSTVDQQRLTTLRGSQDDRELLASIGREYGPFDVIIDDGSHLNDHILTSFDVLLPYVTTGGLYVIEDLWTSYCTGYRGHATAAAAPDTALGLVKRLVDDLHHEEHPRENGELGHAEASVVGIHLYHNIVFLEKGVNAEGGIPQWVEREPFWEK
ncbi:class I SAM-dependent methyltransferase [Amycolatopsis sp. NPDC059021]|uniref:class I SAM-dependent methyltransferase n=1 Tax=Amycolatopsis sp. NPDC059021 TaxID=3346704 RepID=UPI00366C1982